MYRQRDAESNKPLRALLGVIAEQVGGVQDNIAALYDDWFIETCEPWVVPYIGDLVGAILRHSDTTGTVNRRSYVANTISYRRRKGTLLVMEDVARDLTGCGAKAVEFFELLGWTQYANHFRSSNFKTPDMRNVRRLELLGTPFDSIAHTLEARSITSLRGYYNVPNIGVFLYRLLALPVTDAPACAVDATNQHFTFDALGRDTQLFNFPATETGEPRPSKPTDVAIPITRLALSAPSALDSYYGSDKSFEVTLDSPSGSSVILPENITVCDLTDWKHTPKGAPGSALAVAVDPVLGRIAFSQPEAAPIEVRVNYHHGFSAEIGGGFYSRPDPDPYSDTNRTIMPFEIEKGGTYPTIQDAFNAWTPDKTKYGSQYIVFEIKDSEVYEDPLAITIPPGWSVELRAAQGCRPIVKSSGPVQITGEPPGPSDFHGANLVVNGLYFACPVEVTSPGVSFQFELIPSNSASFTAFLEAAFGYEWASTMSFAIDATNTQVTGTMADVSHTLTLTLTADGAGAILNVDGTQVYTFPAELSGGNHVLTSPRGLGWLTLRHCTLMPGQGTASLKADAGNDDLNVTIDSSVVGGVDTSACEATLTVTDSIVDGQGSGGGGQAVACYEFNSDASTFFGPLGVTMVGLVSNSIFRDPIVATRRQSGCVRFSYLTSGSRVPRPYRCQPRFSPDATPEENRVAALKVALRFTSDRYGDPGYGQLYRYTHNDIFEGADNGSEMGAFNSLMMPVRIANLRSALVDYTRFGLDTGVFMAS